MRIPDEPIECPPGTTFFWSRTSEGLINCSVRPDDGVRHGPWVRENDEEGVLERGEYRDGKRHGRWTIKHLRQEAIEQGEYREDRREGLWTLEHVSGDLLERGEYRDGRRQGAWFRKDLREDLIEQGEYRDDQRQGRWVRQHLDGRLRSEGTYQNDVPNGEWSSYTEGRLKAKGTFLRGVRSGQWSYVGGEGLTEASGEYLEDQPVGVWSLRDGVEARRIDFGRPGDESRQHWRVLHGRLFGPASAPGFSALLALLEGWPESELDEAVWLTERRMASWPDEVRFVPYDWSNLILRGIQAWDQLEFYGGKPQTPEELRRLKLWPLTRSLELKGIDTSTEDLRRVVGSALAANVTRLELHQVWARGYGDVLINPGFPKLQSLHLSECSVSVSSLVALAGSSLGAQLRSFSLAHEDYSDEELAPLFASAGFEQLKDFYLLGCTLDEHCARAIYKDSFLHQLESLHLEPDDLSEEFLRRLGGLRFTQIRSLRIGRDKLGMKDRACTHEEVRAFIAGLMRRQRPKKRWG